MSTIITLATRKIKIALLSILIFLIAVQNTFAQCATGTAPAYTKTCSVEYYQSINATGIGVTSTISVSGITSCSSTYINDFATQGIITMAGNTVNVNITRATGYTAYLSVYADWNNNGMFDLSELCGTLMTIPSTTGAVTYTFTVPLTGIVTGIHLPIRLFLSESATGYPCSGTYGQTYDFYIMATCPPTTLSISPIKDSVCIGGTGDTLTASGAGTGGTYIWAPTAGLSATTGAIVIATPTVATTYTVTGTTSIGCSGKSTEMIKINPSPLVDTARAEGILKFCFGDSVLLTDTVRIAGYTYNWYNGATLIPGATDTSYYAKTSGSYTIGVTNSSGCTTLSTSVVVTANPLPAPVIVFDGKIFRVAKYYKTYQWYENNVAISGAIYDSVIAKSNGSFQVKVVDTNGCEDTAVVYVLKRLGLENTTGNYNIKMYPNPANNVLHIDAPVQLNAVISSVDGRKIKEQQKTNELNITSLPTGMYIIELFDDSGQRLAIRKFFKN